MSDSQNPKDDLKVLKCPGTFLKSDFSYVKILFNEDRWAFEIGARTRTHTHTHTHTHKVTERVKLNPLDGGSRRAVSMRCDNDVAGATPGDGTVVLMSVMLEGRTTL